ncbi:hypothetical protein Tco_1074851 [Tanacetum coccineum]
MSVRPHTPPLPSICTPPLPLPSPPTHTNPTYVEAPLGYKAAEIRLRDASPPWLLPSTSHKSDIPETDMPFRKGLCLTAPTGRFEVGESSAAAAAARQPGLDVTPATNYIFVDAVDATVGRPMSREVGYGIKDVWDDMDARIGSLETLVATLVAQTLSLQTQLTTALGRIQTLEARELEAARDLEPQDEPADACSNC